MHRYLPPIVFDSVYKANNEKYTVTLTFDDNFKPDTVTTECFEVRDSLTDEKIDIKEVAYSPFTRQVVLVVEPDYLYGLDCEVDINDKLVYMDGSATNPQTVTAEITPEYSCDLYGVAVKSIRLYGQVQSIPCPVSNEDFVAKVAVLNATNQKQTKRLKVYRNDEADLLLIDTIVTVDADSTKEFIYSIEGVKWERSDVLRAEIIN